MTVRRICSIFICMAFSAMQYVQAQQDSTIVGETPIQGAYNSYTTTLNAKVDSLTMLIEELRQNKIFQDERIKKLSQTKDSLLDINVRMAIRLSEHDSLEGIKAMNNAKAIDSLNMVINLLTRQNNEYLSRISYLEKVEDTLRLSIVDLNKNFRVIDSLNTKLSLMTLQNKEQSEKIFYLENNEDSLSSEIRKLKKNFEVIDSLNDVISSISEINDKQLGRIIRLEQLCDSLFVSNASFQKRLEEKNALLEEKINALQEKEQLFAEKEKLYQDAISNSNVDKVKLEGLVNAKNVSIDAKTREIEYLQKSIVDKETSLDKQIADYQKASIERERYRLLSDTLRMKLNEAERTILKTNEALKYTEQRAREAEAQIKQATSKKKKVRVIQGLAMRLYRTPDWSTRPVQIEGANGMETVYKITNKNGGSVEFDFITGASVMLWDLTNLFNHTLLDTSSTAKIKRFDQEFSYDLGLYIGFGGSNLFKNFYIGPSFKFLDFFHVAIGANVAEYEALVEGLKEGDLLPAGFSIDEQTNDVWKVTMFLSISLDLDFLSYIKK
ncbi:MAG: hypothetical protein J6V54_01230 [Bacteroidales bacterium]|nr:hypothetical protein [Bacteroidales bacterium]